MPSSSLIQLETKSLSTEKPWISELLSISLDEKSLTEFMDRHIKRKPDTYYQSDGGPFNLLLSFSHRLLTFSEEEISHFNPSDDLLYRLKLLDVKLTNVKLKEGVRVIPYCRTLLDPIMYCRAVKLMSVNEDIKTILRNEGLQLTREVIQLHPVICQKYKEIVYMIDDEFKELVDLNQNNLYYRCEITSKLAAILDFFTQNASNLKSLYAFMKLGELMSVEFPYYTSAQRAAKINIFTAGLPKGKVSEFYSFELAEQVCNKMITHPETQHIAYLIYYIKMGRDCLLSVMGSEYKSPVDKTSARFVALANAVSNYIFDDLAENVKLRKRLDLAIEEVIQYGREKESTDFNSVKSEAALRLAAELRALSDNYFSDPEKNDDIKQKFHSDCLAAVNKANVILAVHESPRWQRVLRKVLLAVSSVLTLGLTLAAKRYYSNATTGCATFFKDITRGAGKTRKIVDIIESSDEEMPKLVIAPSA